jgi:hypothetical protein
MRGEGSVQKSIGEVGTRQTPRRRSFEERKRKKGKEGMMMMMIQMEKQQCQRNLWSTGGTVINVCTQRAPFYPFSMHCGRKKIFRGGAYSSPHIISAQGEKEADPIVLLFSSFSINRHHIGCVCVCVAPVLPLPHQLLCIQVSFYPS